jgi:hypothetical protein
VDAKELSAQLGQARSAVEQAAKNKHRADHVLAGLEAWEAMGDDGTVGKALETARAGLLRLQWVTENILRRAMARADEVHTLLVEAECKEKGVVS